MVAPTMRGGFMHPRFQMTRARSSTRSLPRGINMSAPPVDSDVHGPAPCVPALALAAFTIGISWSKILALPWLPIGIIAASIPFIAMLIEGRRARHRGSHRRLSEAAWTSVGVAILVFLVRYLPIHGQPAPLGGDMAMHTWLARVAATHSVLPANQLPLYPGVPYGVYPLGFHGLVALFAGGTEQLVGSAHLVVALTHTLFAVAILHLLRSTFDQLTAATATLATVFILRGPQAYIGWGGHPCVLGFAFAILAWQSTREFLSSPRPTRLGAAACFTAATAFTHPTAALTLAIAVALMSLNHLRRERHWRTVGSILLLAFVGLMLAFPMAVELSRVTFSEAEHEWVRLNHLRPPQSPRPSSSLLPDYWKYVFGDAAVMLAALGLIAGALMNRLKLVLALAALLVITPFAVTWYRYSGGPLSLSLYPERVMLALSVPWAILFSLLINGIRKLWQPSAKIFFRRTVAVILTATLILTAMINADTYYRRAIPGAVMVDGPVLSAMADIAALATETTVVANTTSDAATHLPALLGIAVTYPQWNPIWYDELDEWRARQSPEFLFVAGGGRQHLAGPGVPPDAMLLKRSTSGQDTVAIWRLR